MNGEDREIEPLSRKGLALLMVGSALFFGALFIQATNAHAATYKTVSWFTTYLVPNPTDANGVSWPQQLAPFGQPTCKNAIQSDLYRYDTDADKAQVDALIAHGTLDKPGSGSQWTDSAVVVSWSFIPALTGSQCAPTTPTSPSQPSSPSSPSSPSTTPSSSSNAPSASPSSSTSAPSSKPHSSSGIGTATSTVRPAVAPTRIDTGRGPVAHGGGLHELGWVVALFGLLAVGYALRLLRRKSGHA